MSDKTRMILHLIVAMIVLPGTVLVFVPGVLIYFYGIELPHPTYISYWIAKPLLPAGFVIAGWTVSSFFVHGKGTPAPWAPPRRLVVSGAYRYVRNPMIIAVLMMLVGEALLFSSRPIGLWCAIFFVLNNIYFLFFEEPALEKRFGDDYRLYKANVRRWLPRLNAWTPPWEPAEDEEEEDPPAHHWEGYGKNRNLDGENQGQDGDQT